jgi:hypothetical protein
VLALIPALLFYSTIVPITLMWYRLRLENLMDALEQKKIALLNEG